MIHKKRSKFFPSYAKVKGPKNKKSVVKSKQVPQSGSKRQGCGTQPTPTNQTLKHLACIVHLLDSISGILRAVQRTAAAVHQENVHLCGGIGQRDDAGAVTLAGGDRLTELLVDVVQQVEAFLADGQVANGVAGVRAGAAAAAVRAVHRRRRGTVRVGGNDIVRARVAHVRVHGGHIVRGDGGGVAVRVGVLVAGGEHRVGVAGSRVVRAEDGSLLSLALSYRQLFSLVGGGGTFRGYLRADCRGTSVLVLLSVAGVS